MKLGTSFKLRTSFKKKDLLGWIGPLILLTIVAVLGLIRGEHGPDELDWESDLSLAQEVARRSHRPILLMFHTQGCPWCAKMDIETFGDPHVLVLARRFVCVRVDGEMAPELRNRFGVMGYPTTVFLDSNAKILGKLPDFVPASRFRATLDKVLHLPDLP